MLRPYAKNEVDASRVRLAGLMIRLGLAAVFGYAAIAAFLTPSDWVGYLPHMVTRIVPALLALKAFSTVELVLALWLLSGRFMRYAGILAAAIMVAIMVSDIYLFAITFRDVAIAFAAVALAILGDI